MSHRLITHLELRLGELATHGAPESSTPSTCSRAGPLASGSTFAELEILLQELGVSRVETLDVLLERADLAPAEAACVTRLSERMPALRGTTLTCTRMPDGDATSLCVDLHSAFLRCEVAFAVDFVLDAGADAFEALAPRSAAAVRNGLADILVASRVVRSRGVPVRWIIPLTRILLYRLEPLFSLARDEGIEPILVPASVGRAAREGTGELLDQDDRLFVRDFIACRILDEEKHLHSAARRDWYRALDRALAEHGDPEAVRGGRSAAVSVDAGNEPRWTIDFENHPGIDGAAEEWRTPDPAGSRTESGGRLIEQVADVAGVLVEGGLAFVQWCRARVAELARGRRDAGSAARLNTVLLIGAYGGDHVGDAAILGGVLFRIHRRHGTTRAILMSQRPAHTCHLVSMLETPVPVEVDAYEQARIRAHISQVDAVVFAGGPLIDLPKQLVRHLYAAAMARRCGKPFIMEGIGPGPFARWPSEWVARRLVRLAQRISVRTSADAGSPILQGRAAEIGRDPAFDYLATRGARLTRLRAQDQEWMERLLQDTNGRLVIGMNLRPIRHLFTVGGPAGERAAYTRRIETRCEEQLAEGMRLFHHACPAPPCFVFFPMNAVQFGMSDLRSAYRLRRLLDADVDFRVWQADAGLDGVVALLRRLDIVITMRFHATIFALAQQRRVIGIDYRIGKQDKVGDLLSDLKQSQNCRRIDEMASDWLCERLTALSVTPDAATESR